MPQGEPYFVMVHSDCPLLTGFSVPVDDLREIFGALEKCCAAQSPNDLRKFLSKTLVENQKFVTQCCMIIPALKLEHHGLVENIVSVLEVRSE